jgi:hypothetical protein
MKSSLIKDKFKPFDKWSFVDRNDLDTEHWYVRLEGGEYHNVIFRYMDVKLNETTESINFDYEVIEYPGENPHGTVQFNTALGDILKSILDDTMTKQDYVLGPKEEENES